VERQRIEAIEATEAALREFVDKQLLKGQGADVTASTPLFDLGILDSFALLGLLAFIDTAFNVTLQLEEIGREDFATIHAIARFVHARLAASAAP
jgi:acyl carrier protein